MVVSKTWLIFIQIGLFIILVGCSPTNGEVITPNPTHDEEIMKPNSQDIQNAPTDDSSYGEEALYSANEGGQIIVQGDLLRIGVGAIRSGEYIDEDGQSQSGALAYLSFFVRDHPELEQDIDVYEGIIITVADYRVRVTEINVDAKLVIIKIAALISP